MHDPALKTGVAQQPYWPGHAAVGADDAYIQVGRTSGAYTHVGSTSGAYSHVAGTSSGAAGLHKTEHVAGTSVGAAGLHKTEHVSARGQCISNYLTWVVRPMFWFCMGLNILA